MCTGAGVAVAIWGGRTAASARWILAARWRGAGLALIALGMTVTFFFKPDQWAARLQELMRTDPVSAIGQVDLVDQSHVIFNRCELVKP
jgi:hypothetical protein